MFCQVSKTFRRHFNARHPPKSCTSTIRGCLLQQGTPPKPHIQSCKIFYVLSSFQNFPVSFSMPDILRNHAPPTIRGCLLQRTNPPKPPIQSCAILWRSSNFQGFSVSFSMPDILRNQAPWTIRGCLVQQATFSSFTFNHAQYCDIRQVSKAFRCHF